MLQVHPPQPMPHAVPCDRLFGPFPALFPSKNDQQPFSFPRAGSRAYHVDPTEQPLHLSHGSLTPPSDMNGSSSGLDVSRTSHGFPRGSAMMSQQTAYGQHNGAMPYFSSNQPAHNAAGQAKVDSGYPYPRSPQSMARPGTAADPLDRRRAANDSVAKALRIPATIDAPQSSLPALAAQVTCLFWFENSSLLQQIEEMTLPRDFVPPISADAAPTTGFRKWVMTIMSTTQVSPNVILLALLFIYRLKKINPSVKGKPGSEFRLLTVALMLGNKFLDDNTYTNKTWAEVSGISVQEVHIMEVEFLSNMKYNLYTSKAQWEEWHVKLGRFGSYCDQALKQLERTPKPSSLAASTLHPPPALPSPPTSNHPSPPFASTYSPSHPTHANTPLLLPQISSAAVSPIGPLPELDLRMNGRKRSYDDQAYEPPPKRASRNFMPHIPQIPSSTGSMMPSAQAPSFPRLPPLPSLSIPSSHGTYTPGQLAPQLPPLGGRAMSTVYPPPVQWSQPPSMPTSAAPVQSNLQSYSHSHGDRSRQASPYPPSSAGSSPVSASFPSSSAHSQNQSRLSPSVFLAQRSSPYRPVRGVTTLLVPPPSASVHNAPAFVGADRMQYQPLGRPSSERRVGHLPYMHHEAWPQSNQFNQWPHLPQPAFHR